MFGALGNISDLNFYMHMQCAESKKVRARFFDFHFQIREMAGFVFQCRSRVYNEIISIGTGSDPGDMWQNSQTLCCRQEQYFRANVVISRDQEATHT